jgi:sporulation protein YlmC with PRC-barrel domain
LRAFGGAATSINNNPEINMIRTLITTTALTTALLVGPAFAQDAAATNQPAQSAGPSDLLTQGYEIVDTDGLASKLLGFPVYTSSADDAERLGEINDIVVNQEGQVAAVIVGVGGFLGVGEKNVAVNYSDLQWVTAADNTERIVLETTREALNAAPAVELVEDQPMETAAAPADQPADDTMATDEAQQQAATEQPAEGTAPADETQQQAATEQPAEGAATEEEQLETGAITQQPAAEPVERLNRENLVDFDETALTAEELIGTNVYGPDDQHIGVIGDFVLGQDGNAIDAVIVDFGGFLGIGTKEVAVAFENLDFFADENGDNRYLVLNVSREQMEQAVAFNRDSYPQEREAQRLVVSEAS